MAQRTRSARQPGDSYFQLVEEFPLVAIRSKAELRQAQRMLDSLLRRQVLDEGGEAYLDTLSDLVQVFEDQHFPDEYPGDGAILAHLLEAHGMTQAQAGRALEIAKSGISEILSGKRRLTRSQIMRVAEHFHVEPSVFLQPE